MLINDIVNYCHNEYENAETMCVVRIVKTIVLEIVKNA